MEKKDFIKKAACWTGYILLACISAYFTCVSLMRWFNADSVIMTVICVIVSVAIVLVAGFALMWAVRQLLDRQNPKVGLFVTSSVLFLLVWGFSFMTNVHYLFITQDGKRVLSTEVGQYKVYLEDAIKKNTVDIDAERDSVKNNIYETIRAEKKAFQDECTRKDDYGLGKSAMTILERIQNYLTKKSPIQEKFVIVENDISSDEYKNKEDVKKQVNDYNSKIDACTERLVEQIVEKYNREKDTVEQQTQRYKNAAEKMREGEDALKKIENSADKYYKFSQELSENLDETIGPEEKKALLEKNKIIINGSNDKESEAIQYSYKSYYPSSRMFNTWTMWDDAVHNRIPNDFSLLGFILLSLIIDLIAFVFRFLCEDR